GRGLEASLGARLDAMQLHEPLNPVLAHANALRKQLFPHARPAVLAFGFGMDGANVDQQRVVADASARPVRINVAGLPVVITAGTDAQRLAGHGNRPLPAMSFDPRVLHTDPFARYAVAF